MATEVGSAPVNGYGHNAYGGPEYGHQASASATSDYGAAPVAGASQTQSDVSKEEVAWYFVESYYTAMSKTPEKLHLFFNKRSQFVSGVEEEKSVVAHGLKAIKDRVTELDFQDCKVRVTNVDAQASDSNIVIQVLGGISNKQQPHRKFAQTFVLAAQTNGYFVLNDIFRYIKDDEDEEVGTNRVEASSNTAAVPEPAPTAVDPAVEPDTKELVVNEAAVQEVDKKLEEVAAKEEAPAAVVNGTPAPAAPEVVHVEESPAVPSSEQEATAPVQTAEVVEPEKPKAPVPTPAPAQPSEAAAPAATAAPPAPPKPAVPKTWAQLASANRASPAAAQASPAPAPVAAKPVAAPATPATSTAPVPSALPVAAREVSPDSNQEGSSGGWQTAGGNHDRKQTRAQNVPTVGQDGKVRAYVKNVGAEVDADELKQALNKFGEVVYFDVARGKNAAFVEYKNLAGFQAAVAANPVRIGSDEMWVEERRVPGAGFSRGGRGGRGGNFESRAQGGRGDYKGTGSPRGGFSGRGRGNGNNAPRGGGRGAAQAA